LPAVADAVLTSTTAGAVVVDLSTAAAVAKQQASVLAERAGVHYVDAAITGAVALSGVRTPLLYAGERFAVVDNLFAALETPVVYLSDSRPGDAVRVKLLRSVIMKGLEALAVDALPAARQYGLLDQLFAVLSDVDQRPFADLLRSMVVTHPGQAERRKAEVAEAAAQLDEVGVAADLTGSVAGRFGRTVDRIAVAGLPGYATLEATLDWFDDAASSNRALVGRGVQG
jgi:3-hydroxyisobutyrate dehydrogenase-like beta-hydroxyacid dehydrogenase